MSSIGPVTPIAAQLVMGVNQNLNESANRSTQLALGRMTQEGFDKQRVFEGEQNALQREQNERLAIEEYQHRQGLQTSAQAHAQKLQSELIAVGQAEKRAALAAHEAAARGASDALRKAREEQAQLAKQREELQQDAATMMQLVTQTEGGLDNIINVVTGQMPDAINEADAHFQDTDEAIGLALQGTLGKLAQAPEGLLDSILTSTGYMAGNIGRGVYNYVIGGGQPGVMTPQSATMQEPSAEENVGIEASVGGDYQGDAAYVVGSRIAERLGGAGLFRQFGNNEGAVGGAVQQAIADSLKATVAVGRGMDTAAVQGFRTKAASSLEALKNVTNKEFVGQVMSGLSKFTETARGALDAETIAQNQATGGLAGGSGNMTRLLDSLAGVGAYAQSLGYVRPEGNSAQFENVMSRVIAAKAQSDPVAFEQVIKDLEAKEGAGGPAVQKLTRYLKQGLLLQQTLVKQMASKKALDQKARQLAEQESMLGEAALADAALTGAQAERQAYDQFVPEIPAR